jgi:hypothetical protein
VLIYNTEGRYVNQISQYCIDDATLAKGRMTSKRAYILQDEKHSENITYPSILKSLRYLSVAFPSFKIAHPATFSVHISDVRLAAETHACRSA